MDRKGDQRYRTAKSDAWSRFWDARGRTYPEDDPRAIDGWDYGISRMGEKQAEARRRQIASELALTPGSEFLEIGCGAGMFLIPISEMVGRAAGCDLAESMLNRAHRIRKSLSLQVAEASNLPYLAEVFDAVLVYSVFHYFPSYEYANQVLRELFRVCRKHGKIWIGDVPDLATQRQAQLHRERFMQQQQPVWPWPAVGPLVQRFYDRQFFIDFCEQFGGDYRIGPQRVSGYIQGQYRFNIGITRR